MLFNTELKLKIDSYIGRNHEKCLFYCTKMRILNNVMERECNWKMPRLFPLVFGFCFMFSLFLFLYVWTCVFVLLSRLWHSVFCFIQSKRQTVREKLDPIMRGQVRLALLLTGGIARQRRPQWASDTARSSWIRRYPVSSKQHPISCCL